VSEPEPDYYIDVRGLVDSVEEANREPRPWVGIQFDCCNVYVRVYREADAKAYEGRCPRCCRKIRLRVGKEGTPARFFRAE
jgi:hypothetical protein